MKEKTLFEIPIYSMTEKEFNQRWKKIKDNLYKKFVSGGHTDKSKLNNYIHELNFPRDVWKYNQIIGYVRLSVTRQDVVFAKYLARSERYHADSRVKKFIEYIPIHGANFYTKGKSDEEIKRKIFESLKHIEKFHIKKRFYVDYSVFNNIIDHINIKDIMDSL